MTISQFGKNRVNIQNTSNAIWWIKDPQKVNKNNFIASTKNDVKDFFQNVSLHGYNKLLSANAFERLIWVCVHVMTFILSIIAISSLWEVTTESSLQMRHEDPTYPIDLVQFPALTVCPNTRLSLKRVKEYATLLSERDPDNHTSEYFMEKMKFFELFFIHERVSINFRAIIEFQDFLNRHGAVGNSTQFSSREVIKFLAQPCEEFIKLCIIGLHTLDCFSNDTFVTTYTSEGICCTFNSQNRYATRDNFLTGTPHGFRFRLKMNYNESDNFFTNLNSDGYELFIHNPSTIVNIMSGGIDHLIPNHYESSSVGINAIVITTDDALKKYSAKERYCYYSREGLQEGLLLNTNYTYSNCVLRCMANYVRTICGCTPFYISMEYFRADKYKPYCNMLQSFCLLNHSFKFSSILDSKEIAEVSDELELERIEGMYCNNCYPLCEYVQFKASLVGTLKYRNETRLQVFFKDRTAVLMKYIESNTWNQTFSTFGNVTSIILGFSMVALFEVLYYMLKYLKKIFKIFFSINNKTNHKLNEKLSQNELIICP